MILSLCAAVSVKGRDDEFRSALVGFEFGECEEGLEADLDIAVGEDAAVVQRGERIARRRQQLNGHAGERWQRDASERSWRFSRRAN